MSDEVTIHDEAPVWTVSSVKLTAGAISKIVLVRGPETYTLLGLSVEALDIAGNPKRITFDITTATVRSN